MSKFKIRKSEECREIKLRYDFCIKPYQSKGITRTGHVYTPTKISDFKNLVILDTMRQWRKQKPLEGPIMYSADYAFPILKTMPKKVKEIILSGKIFLKVTKPDITDNTQKAFIDAVSKALGFQDQEISVTGEIRKFFDEKPYILATFKELPNPLI